MSSCIQWSEDYVIDGGIIDEHHKKLFQLCRDLSELLDNKDNIDKDKYGCDIVKCLSDLIKYTIFHFKAEEKFMYEKHFPLVEQHALQHEVLVQRVSAIRDRYQESGLDSELKFLLTDWLKQHILNEDMQIKDCLD
jgi:hemerythrin